MHLFNPLAIQECLPQLLARAGASNDQNLWMALGGVT